jgi:hypothetical protein
LRSEVIPKEQLEDYGIDVGEDGSGMERKRPGGNGEEAEERCD